MASMSAPCSTPLAYTSPIGRAQNQKQQQPSNVSFTVSANSGTTVIVGFLQEPQGSKSKRTHSTVLKAKVNNELAVESSNSTILSPNNLEAPSSNAKKKESAKEPRCSDESMFAFMSEVASLIKLVDSRDISELQLKQNDYEIIIRKKEALSPPVTAAPVMMQQPAQPSKPTTLPPAPPVQAAASAPVSSVPSPSAHLQFRKSSHPPLKCPMAGTFYKSPAPGEPPFVKIGDKVKKGQVLCIIEAMKLMNEIEADQSGTIVEILAEDGKPVSVDTPLLVIQP